MFKKNKAQAWYIDIMFATLVFSVSIILFFKYVPNIQNQETQNLNILILDGKTMTNSLVSEGFPRDWNKTNVERIGITNEKKIINQSKVQMFYELSKNDYNKTKNIFKLSGRANYIIFFTNPQGSTINLTSSYYIGSPGITLDANKKPIMSTFTQTNFIALDRILRYKNSTIIMVAYIWD